MADLPSADEFFSPKEPITPTDGGQLPTADEFFAPNPSTMGLATKAAGSIITGEGISNPAVDNFLQQTPVGRIMKSFGSGFAAGGEGGSLGIEPNGDVETALTKAGIFNDHTKNENNFLKSVNEAFIRPAAVAIDNEARGAQAAIGAIGGGLMQTAHEVGTAIEGNNTTPLLEQFAEFTLMHNAELPTHIEQARSVGAIGESEASYFGLKEPTPQESIARQQASIASEVPEAAEAPAPKDIHTIAREVAPETFAKFDELNTKKEDLQNQLQTARVEQEDIIGAKYSDEIAEIQSKLDTKSNKGLYSNMLEKKVAERDSEISALQDTPDMADLRSQIQQLDFARRDLAPDVSAAYREAQNRLPLQEEKSPTEPDLNKPNTEESVNASSSAQQISNIVQDVSSKFTKAGRSQEEADALGQLVAERYKTASELGYQVKGVPRKYITAQLLILKRAKKLQKPKVNYMSLLKVKILLHCLEKQMLLQPYMN